MIFDRQKKKIFRTLHVIHSRRPSSWDQLFARIREGAAPNDFLLEAERHQEATTRDPFAGIDE